MVYRPHPGTEESPTDVITKAALSPQSFNTLGDVLTARQTDSYSGNAAYNALYGEVPPKRGTFFRSVLSSFGVVLMSCRVNFHVVRSALQYSACRI